MFPPPPRPVPNITQISFGSVLHQRHLSSAGMALDGLNQPACFILVAAVTSSGIREDFSEFFLKFQNSFERALDSLSKYI